MGGGSRARHPDPCGCRAECLLERERVVGGCCWCGQRPLLCVLETSAWTGLRMAEEGSLPRCGQFPQCCQLGLCRYIRKAALSGTPGHPSVHTSSLSTSSLTASRTSDTFTCERLPYPHYYRVSTKGFPRNTESNDVSGGWPGRESSRLAETPSVTQPPGCPGRAWPGQDEERGAAGAGAPRRGQERVWPTGGPAELIQDQGGGQSPLGNPEPPGRNRVKKPPYIQVQTHGPWDPGEQTSDLRAQDSEQGGTRSHLLQKPHFTAAQRSPQVKVGATELPWVLCWDLATPLPLGACGCCTA